MINVIALYADRSGCGDYRVRFPALAVNKHDTELHVHIEVSDHIPADATYDTGTSKYHIRRVDVPRGVKVVSFQRPLKAVMAGAIMWLHEHRPDIAIVVDLDDDLAGVPTSNTAYAAVHPKASPQENYQWLRQAIALADVFTCSTPDIAERYGYDRNRTVVIRNGIPSHMLDQPARTMAPHRERSDGSDRIIGWAGHIGTHNGDLDVTCNALADVVGADRTDGRRVTFRNVGPREGVAKALGLQESDVSATGWLKPPLYRLALSELDVGIVPLADTRFNRAKCLDADTWITTRRSMLRAGELREGDEVWHDGDWKKIIAVEHAPPRPGFEIVTTRGYTLSLTPEHRLWTGDAWVLAKDIRQGMKLATEPEHRDDHDRYVSLPWPADGRMSRENRNDAKSFWTAEHGPTVTIDETWGKMLGVIMGDGSVGLQSVGIACNTDDTDLVQWVMDTWRSIGLHPKYSEKKWTHGKQSRACDVRVSSAHLLRFLELAGAVYPRVMSHDYGKVATIPDVIWHSPPSVGASYLSGLFATDGTVTAGCSLSTKHETLARDVQRLLLTFGVQSHLTCSPNYQKPGVVRWYWDVVVGARAGDVFVEKIGMGCYRKHTQMVAARARRSAPGSHGHGKPVVWEETVDDIRPTMVMPVDIQVDGEVFAAAGFVSHNSALKVLEFAAAGVPVIASYTPEHVRLRDMGLPIWLVKPARKHWVKALRSVVELDNAELRDLAIAHREFVRRTETMESRAVEWASAFRLAARVSRELTTAKVVTAQQVQKVVGKS